jgi:N4-gp56 family major capsid protein
MAATTFGVNDPLAVKLWSKKLFTEALKKTWFSKFIGSDSSALIQRKDDTSKGAGDRVRVGLRMLLSGAGVQGDGTLEGNEEALTTYNDEFYINQLRHAVRTGGEMSQQRVPFSVRQESMDGLSDWWADRLDTCFFNQLGGNTGQADTRYTGNNATIAPDADHLFISSPTNQASLEASLSASTDQSLKLVDIDRAVAKAKTLSPMIRPLKVEGEDVYVLFAHPYSIYQMRADATRAGNFVDIQKAAMMGGKIANNPIMTGASFMYNNVIVHEAVRVPLVPGQTLYRRNIFCGAQAGLIGYGKQIGSDGKPGWVEELFDYENQLGVAGRMIFGIKKAVFNSRDFGTIVISSYAPSV